jgi:DNA-directed RNA polymerase subunit H (RpoH/RPB5)
MSSTQIFRLYQLVFDSRRYLLEMLEDRGFDVDHLKNYSSDEIKTMLDEHSSNKFGILSDVGPLDIFLEKELTGGGSAVEKVFVKYRLEERFKDTTSINNQINEIFEKHLTKKDTLIIININRLLMKIAVKEKPDEDFVNDLYIRKGYFVQLFGLENFLFNVSRHQFVPKHRVMSDQEVKDLLANYNITADNIPTIKRDDPQAKYIGLRYRQICEIIGENITSGVRPKYRLCIH